MTTKYMAALAIAASIMVPTVQAETFATSTGTFTRGSVPGDFPGFYGGSFPGSFPVPLDDATARASVLGTPDNGFVSLPGSPGIEGEFIGAYGEVSFGSNFNPNTILKIWELGDNQESARVFLWGNNGGNVHFDFTRGATDLTSFDLSSYAGALASIDGSTSITKIGIGGLDQLGSSKGFDLDAVSISPIPEPETYAMLMAGLGLIGFMARRKKMASSKKFLP
jgi:PEP-CTERM motif